MIGNSLQEIFSTDRPSRLLLAGLMLVTLMMLLGMAKLQFNDDYKSLFKTDREEYQELESFLNRFPADDQELVILFRADRILAEPTIFQLQEVVEKIEGTPAIESLFSIFSIPEPNSSIRRIDPLLSVESMEEDLEASLLAIGGHPMVRNKLLSEDGRLTIAVAILEEGYVGLDQISEIIERIHTITDQVGDGAGLEVFVTGNAAIRVALKSQSTRDQILLNSIGGLLAFSITLFLFRSFKLSLIITAGPLIGVIWTLGCMGFMGSKLNVINQMISPLVMVIGFTDAIHLMFAIQRRRIQGLSRVSASIAAIKDVGMACMLTSITTAIGFAVLILTDSTVIQELALHASIGVLLTFVAVVIFIPASAALLEDDVILNSSRLDIRLTDNRILKKVLVVIGENAVAVVSVGVVLTALAVYQAQQLTTDFKFRENLPQSHEVSEAMRLADRHLNGIQPLNIVIQANNGGVLESTQAVELITRVQVDLIEQFGLTNSISVVDLLRVLPGGSDDLSQQFSRLVYLPSKLVNRFYHEQSGEAVILVRLPDNGANMQLETITQLEELLSQLSEESDRFSLRLQGISLAAAKGSVDMIQDLLVSILSAVVIIFLVLSLFLKSIKLGLISFLPNILPLATVAALLVVNDQPLQYATIMVFTICLGIIVDDGIHMIVRYQKEFHKVRNVTIAVHRTLQAIAPVLLVTTLILLAGFVSMLTSSTEVIVRMGYLSCVALIMALLADLVLLPSLIVATSSKDRVEDCIEEQL
ncbi:MAG: efflux RND transporter permease subunit [Candidatus Thiodiazotropha endolucinida]|nr:efflux RND transporter permease subunit [Candidatus Thiodiazotropha taylori]MCW4277002.1 efflux RND transporter permease subunit [Candidatus Thiodiazotropha taylori]